METDYIVIRPADDLPENAAPREMDGEWVDVAQLIRDYGFDPEQATCMGHPAVPTDRTETREDGAVARVWEVRP